MLWPITTALVVAIVLGRMDIGFHLLTAKHIQGEYILLDNNSLFCGMWRVIYSMWYWCGQSWTHPTSDLANLSEKVILIIAPQLPNAPSCWIVINSILFSVASAMDNDSLDNLVLPLLWFRKISALHILSQENCSDASFPLELLWTLRRKWWLHESWSRDTDPWSHRF